MAVRSVPFLGNKSCLGPSRILNLASQIGTNDNHLRMPRHNNSVLVRTKRPPPSTVMSISIKQDFTGARTVGPFGPTKEKGVHHLSLFSGCMESIRGHQSVPTHLANNISFGSFQCSLSALCKVVMTRPDYSSSSIGRQRQITGLPTSRQTARPTDAKFDRPTEKSRTAPSTGLSRNGPHRPTPAPQRPAPPHTAPRRIYYAAPS